MYRGYIRDELVAVKTGKGKSSYTESFYFLIIIINFSSSVSEQSGKAAKGSDYNDDI